MLELCMLLVLLHELEFNWLRSGLHEYMTHYTPWCIYFLHNDHLCWYTHVVTLISVGVCVWSKQSPYRVAYTDSGCIVACRLTETARLLRNVFSRSSGTLRSTEGEPMPRTLPWCLLFYLRSARCVRLTSFDHVRCIYCRWLCILTRRTRSCVSGGTNSCIWHQPSEACWTVNPFRYWLRSSVVVNYSKRQLNLTTSLQRRTTLVQLASCGACLLLCCTTACALLNVVSVVHKSCITLLWCCCWCQCQQCVRSACFVLCCCIVCMKVMLLLYYFYSLQAMEMYVCF